MSIKMKLMYLLVVLVVVLAGMFLMTTAAVHANSFASLEHGTPMTLISGSMTQDAMEIAVGAGGGSPQGECVITSSDNCGS